MRGHRRKLSGGVFNGLKGSTRTGAMRLCILLRLAVLLNRSRSSRRRPVLYLDVDDNSLTLSFPEGTMDDRPLTLVELEREAEYLRGIDYELHFQQDSE